MKRASKNRFAAKEKMTKHIMTKEAIAFGALHTMPADFRKAIASDPVVKDV